MEPEDYVYSGYKTFKLPEVDKYYKELYDLTLVLNNQNHLRELQVKIKERKRKINIILGK